MESRASIKRHLKHLEDTHNKYVFLVQALFEEDYNGEAMDDLEHEMKASESFVEAQISRAAVNQNENFKLQSIKFPIFSGDYNELTSFYDTFSTLVHENKEIFNIEKCHFLKSSLTDKSSHLLMLLKISAANCNTAWNALKECYDNKRVIMRRLVNFILSIKSIPKGYFMLLCNLLNQSVQNL